MKVSELIELLEEENLDAECRIPYYNYVCDIIKISYRDDFVLLDFKGIPETSTDFNFRNIVAKEIVYLLARTWDGTASKKEWMIKELTKAGFDLT